MATRKHSQGRSSSASAAIPKVARKPQPPSRRPAGPARANLILRLGEEEIYERMHDAVLDHRLLPGTKLKEVALAKLFGVNRSVIRKVLTRLAYNKLVLLRPNRGALVASPSVAESRDLYAARRSIEGAIVEAVTHRITPPQIKSLRALAASENAAYRQGEMRRGLKLSLKFHQMLAEIAGNGVLAELLDQLIARTPLVVLAYKGRGDKMTCSIDEHTEIIDAIAGGNATKAVAAMTAHLESLEGQLDLSDETEPATDLAALFGEIED
jgi:DNA-binding GntR family transcriptional regulator